MLCDAGMEVFLECKRGTGVGHLQSVYVFVCVCVCVGHGRLPEGVTAEINLEG